MPSEFKISRLIYSWVGEWAPATVYKRDSISEYEGKLYLCIVPHTASANFYTDLDYPVYPRWTLMVDGHAWKTDWQTNTFYSLGNLVRYGGVVYICTEAHQSGPQQIDPLKWDTYARFGKWENSWQTSSVYGVDDIVKYGGVVYRCTENHLSASTISLGLENDFSKWEIVNLGVEYKGNWTGSSYRYKLNDIVKDGPDLYLCTSGHTSSATFDESKWNLWIPGLEFVNTWNAGIVYQPGDSVLYGGYSYKSLTQNNTGNIPSTDSTNWVLLTTGYDFQGDWNTQGNYKVGDVLRRNGNLFTAIKDSNSKDPLLGSVTNTYVASGSSGTTLEVFYQDSSAYDIVPGMMVRGTGFTRGQTIAAQTGPTTFILNEGPDGTPIDGEDLTFVGIDFEYWALLNNGVYWRGFWEENISYIINDLVYYQNVTYRCIQNHSSSMMTNNPKTDTSRNYWVVYTLHDRYNALINVGDIVYFDGTDNVPLPIPIESLTVETPETKLLKVVNKAPSWEKAFITTNVFYVATTGFDGTDYPDRGKTWDHPYKTIKYACGIVAAGTQYQSTKTHVFSNKPFILEEMWQWMEYQKANSLSPYSPSSTYDEEKTRRDAGFVIDAILYDITRGGNSQTVATAKSFFKYGHAFDFINSGVAAKMPFFIPALTYLKTLMNYVINNTEPPVNYQLENNPVDSTVILQVLDDNYSTEGTVINTVNSYLDLIITALTDQSTEGLPSPNNGLTATIYVKTGTYKESLPIVVPANTAVVGDELRGTTIEPEVIIKTYSTSTSGLDNTFTVISTEGMEHNTPVQFVTTGEVLDDFPSVVAGQTYYVNGPSITSTKFSVSETEDGDILTLAHDSGNMYVFGGDAIKNMFYMQDATGLRNCSLNGLLGTLTAENAYQTRRPTGGAYVSLDPGTGPDDTSVWIYRRSPYIQNVTTFGYGCIGMKVDGTLHNGGNKSMVSNDFTQILSDGIGLWITGPGSLTEAVSVFTYYNYASYFAEDGGRIRGTNGNSSYGTYGVIAEGYDYTEDPVTGNVNNRSTQAQATVQSAFGVDSALLKLQYSNAGNNYVSTTTNMLTYNNTFTSGWTNDGNVTLTQSITPPFGYTKGWTFNGTTSSTDASYLYQNVTITPAGGVYTGLTGTNESGSGVGAIFDVTVGATAYSVSVSNGGSGYVSTNVIKILGSNLGGRDGINDLYITVDQLAVTAIQTVLVSGTVPPGSNLGYTLSIYAGKGTVSSFDIYAFFTGSSTRASSLTYNFDTDTLTPAGQDGGGITPTVYGRNIIDDTWVRVWFNVYDPLGLNNTLQYRIYPRTRYGSSGSTYFYGPQLQISEGAPTFPLHTGNNRYTAHASYEITGAGTGANIIGDEIRSNSVFQVRVVSGGSDYLTASNNAQGGDPNYIIISQSDINEASNLERMRLIITSGTGAGQYGYIGNFNTINKYAHILKESFTPLEIIGSTTSTNVLTLGNTDTSSLYSNMPLQFIPTYYTTNVTSASQDMQMVTQVVGGLINQITVEDTTRLYQWMPISFAGTTFGGVITNYTYYISLIVDGTHIQVSNELYGTTIFLNTSSGLMTLLFPANNNYFIADSTTNMDINMPIQFTGSPFGGIDVGTTYYVNDVVDSTTFTISNSNVTITASNTTASTNVIDVDDANSLVPLNPIKFDGTTFGGIVKATKYYINKIVSSTSLTISDTLITTTVTSTAITSNLITCGSTSGFVTNNPIKFVGTTFGGLISGFTYYILAVNDGVSFTVSFTVGGGAVTLTTATGECTAKTLNAAKTLTTSSGSMTAKTTSTLITLSSGTGSMEATFSTDLFGNVQAGVDYYIKTITPGSPSTIQVSTSPGGTAVPLVTSTGSMQIGEVGWDHVNAGTQPELVLDSTSLYFIEARPTFTDPSFSQTNTSSGLIPLAPGTSWSKLAYGDNYWMAMPDGGNTAMGSSDGITWSSIVLPTSGTPYTDITYGNKYWIIISNSTSLAESGSRVLYSNSQGDAWRVSYLPSKTTWSNVIYGNGVFVAIATGTSTAAYSNNHGVTWSSATGLPSATWTGLAYGKGIFVAVASGGTQAAYSTNGSTWISSTLPSSTAWKAIAFGKGMFVAISSTSSVTAYSFDGSTWYQSNIAITADRISYGQGVFLALNSSSSTTCYTCTDGLRWQQHTVTNSGYSDVQFGFKDTSYEGVFVTVASQSTGSNIVAGARTVGRATIISGEITEINMIQTGSGYTDGIPTITITDPNVTVNAVTTTRVGNGVLSSPSFVSRGTGYNTNSTVVTINGDGYADQYQTGLTLSCVNITKLPNPGDNLVVNGNSKIYKVTNATVLEGTSAPNLKVDIQIAPDMTVALSPAHNTAVTIRQKYSQVRLTNHDFLNVGYGNFVQSNYPGTPTLTELSPQNQTIENNYGRVFYTSTDQDGNFKVGSLFGVEQATGIVTLSASQFGLTGLETLRLGGVAVGSSSVVISQFSTDPTFIANSNNIIPTQKSIRSYLTSRLTQGGSNTFTGQLTAGTVVIGGADRITNTIPEGIEGSSVQMLNKVNVFGQTAGIDGDMAAYFAFVGTWIRPN